MNGRRAKQYASAAAHTAKNAVLLRVINQFVHKTLAKTLFVSGARVAVRHLGKRGGKASVPTAVVLGFTAGYFVR